MTVPFVIAGKPADLIGDTGAPRSAIRAATAERLFGIGPDSQNVKKIVRANDSGEPGTHYLAQFKTMSVGGLTIKNPQFVVLADKMTQRWVMDDPGKVGDPHLPALILGLEELEHLHLYIAYGEAAGAD